MRTYKPKFRFYMKNKVGKCPTWKDVIMKDVETMVDED